MLRSRCDDINTGGVDVGVAQDICQLRNILFQAVKHPGKQVAQIMGKYLIRCHTCLLTQLLHLAPNIAAIQRLAGLGYKEHSF